MKIYPPTNNSYVTHRHRIINVDGIISVPYSKLIYWHPTKKIKDYIGSLEQGWAVMSHIQHMSKKRHVKLIRNGALLSNKQFSIFDYSETAANVCPTHIFVSNWNFYNTLLVCSISANICGLVPFFFQIHPWFYCSHHSVKENQRNKRRNWW